MADALRKWIIADLESSVDDDSFEWSSFTRRVQLVSFLSFSTDDDPTAHWSASVSDKHCLIEAVFTQACVEKLLAMQVKPTSHRGAVLNILKWKFQTFAGQDGFSLLIDDLTVMGSQGSCGNQVFGDPKPINALISSKLDNFRKNSNDLKILDDAPENMELLIEEMEKKEWGSLQFSYRDYFPSLEQRALLERLFPITKHLPHQLQLSLNPAEEQNEEDTLVSENENNLGFEIISSSQSSGLDHDNNVIPVNNEQSVATTPPRSLPNAVDFSPFSTDTILSEMDKDIASQAAYPNSEKESPTQLITKENEFETQVRFSDEYDSSGSDVIHVSASKLGLASQLPLMTQQMGQLSSLSNAVPPDSEPNFLSETQMNDLSPYSQMRRFALTQASDLSLSNDAKVASDMDQDIEEFNETNSPSMPGNILERMYESSMPYRDSEELISSEIEEPCETRSMNEQQTEKNTDRNPLNILFDKSVLPSKENQTFKMELEHSDTSSISENVVLSDIETDVNSMHSIDSIDSDAANDSDQEPVILLKKRKIGSQEIEINQNPHKDLDEASHDAPEPTPTKSGTASNLLYPVKLIYDFLISPFKTNNESKDYDEISEAEETSSKLQKGGIEKNVPEIMVPEPRLESENEHCNLADDLLSSELAVNYANAGEIICDSQDNELCYEEYMISKHVTKNNSKLLFKDNSARNKTKPRVSIKYNPDQRSNLRTYIDILENRKRRRLSK